MVFNDTGLAQVAEDFGTNSFYLAFSSDTAVEALSTATALDGEFGTRVSCSVTVIDNKVAVSGVRSSTLVIDTTDGDTLTAVAVFDSFSSGQMFVITLLPSILHTINFDLDIDEEYNFDRG